MAEPAIDIITLMAFTALIGYAGFFIFRKTKVPDVIILLLFGTLIGYLGFPKEELFRTFAPILSPLTLLVVLLDCGLHMEMKHVLKSFPRSILLVLLGLFFSMMAAVAVGGVLMGLDLKMSLLLGSIFGGTSDVTVLAILREIKVKESAKSLLSLESVLNDPLCILASVALLGLILPKVAVGSPFTMIAFAFGVGIPAGSIYGLAWIIALSKLKSIQFDYMLTLAVAMLVYVSSEHFFMMGTGALAVLFFGLVLGNALSVSKYIKRRYTLPEKIPLFHSEITFFLRSFFFVYLGIVATIKLDSLIYGIILSIALIAFRFIAVRIALIKANFSGLELNLIRIMGPKGLVAAALTELPVAYGVPGAEIIQSMAFVVIFSTTVFSAVGTAFISRRHS